MSQFSEKQKLKIMAIADRSMNDAIAMYKKCKKYGRNPERGLVEINKAIRRAIRKWRKNYNLGMTLEPQTGKASTGRPKKNRDELTSDDVWDRLTEKEKKDWFEKFWNDERKKDKTSAMNSQNEYRGIFKQARRIEIWNISKQGIIDYEERGYSNTKVNSKGLATLALVNTVVDENAQITPKGIKYILGSDPLAITIKNEYQVNLTDRYVRMLTNKLNKKCSIREKSKVPEDKTLDQTIENIANRDYGNIGIDSADVKYINHKSGYGNHIFVEFIVNWGSGLIRSFDLAYSQGAEQTMRNLLNAKLPPGAIFHTDRGSQYCSSEVTEFLAKNKTTRSLSRRANCLDNRNSEHTNSIFQTEVLDFYDTNNMSFGEIKKLIENFVNNYNNKRRQKRLNWLTPNEFMVASQEAFKGQLFIS